MTERELEQVVDVIAGRVAARVGQLLEEAARPQPWLDVAAVAAMLAVEPDFVYQHAARLGARRLGDGPRARLRFRREDVEAAFPCCTSRGSQSAVGGLAASVARRRPTRSVAEGAALVPVRGSRA